MRRYAQFLLQYRVPLSLLLLALLGGSLWALPRVELDLSVISIFEGEGDAKRIVDEFNDRFPRAQVDLTCALEWPGEIGEAELAELARIGRAFEGLPYVKEVTSLATAQIVETFNGVPIVKGFAEVDPSQSVVERTRKHPLLQSTLISHNERAAVILIASDLELDDSRRADLLRLVEEAIEREVKPPVVAHLLGGQLFQRALTYHVRRDMLQSVGLEAIFFLILLPFLFRTIRGMAIPLFTVNCAVALTFGFMALTGLKITALGVAIPGLIVIIALCDAIHMMHRFEESYFAHRDKRRAIIDMMESVGQACFFTSFTTALGFFSLVVARHSAVREFAVTATLAVFIAFFCVIVLLPILLSFWPVRSSPGPGLAGLRTIRYGRHGMTLALFALGLLASVIGIGRIVVDATWLGELPEGDPLVASLAWFEENFNGLLSMEVEIEGALDDPGNFRAVERLQQKLLAEDGVRGVESYTQWVREMVGNPESLSEDGIADGFRFLKLAGESFPAHLTTTDFRHGRIVFQTRDFGIRRYKEIQEMIVAEAAEAPKGLRIDVAGYSRMATDSSRLVVTTLLKSLMVSMVSISLFVALSFRSIRLGLISVVPNALPIVAGLGLTGWLGIELRIGIVMVYCIGVGLAVDDSIHLIARFMQERRRRPQDSNRVLLLRSLASTGRALIITTIVLAIGALTYLPSSFRSMSDVGILLTAIVIFALVTDLFLLPVLIDRFYPGAAEADTASQPEALTEAHSD